MCQHGSTRLLSAWPSVPWDVECCKPSSPLASSACTCSADKKRRRKERPPLLNREDAPPYIATNPYVLSGYRRVSTLREAVDGLFYLHNAWLDTWTSVFSLVHSTVLFIVSVFWLDVFSYGKGVGCVFLLFYLHVVAHTPASIACHLIGNSGISQELHELTLEMDMVMIFTASVILCFTQSAFVFTFTGTLINTSIAISLWLYLVTHLRYVAFDHIRRFTMLLGIGHMYLLPLWYQGLSDWWSMASPSESLPTSLLLAIGAEGSLAIGAIMYAFHLPERLSPGTFDIWFGSHSWMHVMINVAHLCEWLFLVHMLNRRLNSSGM